jgi:multiple sugar transport system ATP-binding protein
MNFLPATVKGDKVELPFVTVDLPEHARGNVPEGKLLIAGIRPEYFGDASVTDADRLAKSSTFQAKVDVVEWLGNEAFAYVPYEAPAELEHQLADLERELDSEALRTQLIVSLDPASRVTGGDQAELFVDARKMHLFEPSSGDNLTLRGGN